MGRKTGFAAALLSWYDREARPLPWRQPPPARGGDPYRVLVSEIMLQQTTVATVLGRFGPFLDQFPDLYALAAAPEDDVLAAWAGLGYYRRARSLHACAQAVVAQHGGVFPRDVATLKTLPGLGDYTAAALSAIAFDQPAVVVDGNIERVVARVFAIDRPLPKAKKEIKDAAAELSPDDRPGDYAQAMMDLGARVCRPKGADCLLCPVRPFCDGQKQGEPERLPMKAAKKAKTILTGTILVLINERGEVFCEKRPSRGLLAGMLGLPGDGWDGSKASISGEAGRSVGTIQHTLTHRELQIEVKLERNVASRAATEIIASANVGDKRQSKDYKQSEGASRPAMGIEGQWLPIEEARSSMPTLFRKALDRALNSVGDE